ncbi:MAG: ABC transporter ATP-binding protein [Chloroflexota bacterium]
MSALLVLRGVRVTFDGLAAVEDASFEVAEGSITGLIGPNGAGKSTVFNAINGVHRPTAGSIEFDGRELVGLAPHRIARLGIARAHQITRPLRDLTVLDNVTVGACFGRDGLGLTAARGVAVDVIDRLGLGALRDQPAGRLNVAWKKRLELARALAAKPRLLLADEVLAGLNAAEVSEMIEVFKGIRDGGTTVCMVEHVMQAVTALCDHVVVLDHGVRIAEGTPAAMAADPAVVAAYLGDPEAARRLLEDPA